jgi:predicted nucleic-acid-binding protein
VRITADTNILIRAILKDDAGQAESARTLLAAATHVAIPLAVFCEFAWVLGGGYRYTRAQVGLAIRQYLSVDTVVTDRPAVQAGLAFLADGGDFAAGAIAYQGRHMGGIHFASFDTSARELLLRQGFQTLSPSEYPVRPTSAPR